MNQTYVLTFDLANNNGGLTPVNSFLVDLGNVREFSFTNASDQGYVHYQASFVAASAATTLKFSGSNDNSYFELDNVGVAATPEPATSELLLAGALAIVLALRRRSPAVNS